MNSGDTSRTRPPIADASKFTTSLPDDVSPTTHLHRQHVQSTSIVHREEFRRQSMAEMGRPARVSAGVFAAATVASDLRPSREAGVAWDASGPRSRCRLLAVEGACRADPRLKAAEGAPVVHYSRSGGAVVRRGWRRRKAAVVVSVARELGCLSCLLCHCRLPRLSMRRPPRTLTSC